MCLCMAMHKRVLLCIFMHKNFLCKISCDHAYLCTKLFLQNLTGSCITLHEHKTLQYSFMKLQNYAKSRMNHFYAEKIIILAFNIWYCMLPCMTVHKIQKQLDALSRNCEIMHGYAYTIFMQRESILTEKKLFYLPNWQLFLSGTSFPGRVSERIAVNQHVA